MSILYINTFQSECGDCPGLSVDPQQTHHITTYGTDTSQTSLGCGWRYTAVSTFYEGSDKHRLEKRIKDMRPDLPYITLDS